MPTFLPMRGAATSTTAACTPSLKPSPSWSGVSVAMGRCHSIDDWGMEKGDRLLFRKQPVPFSTLTQRRPADGTADCGADLSCERTIRGGKATGAGAWAEPSAYQGASMRDLS